MRSYSISLLTMSVRPLIKACAQVPSNGINQIRWSWSDTQNSNSARIDLSVPSISNELSDKTELMSGLVQLSQFRLSLLQSISAHFRIVRLGRLSLRCKGDLLGANFAPEGLGRVWWDGCVGGFDAGVCGVATLCCCFA